MTRESSIRRLGFGAMERAAESCVHQRSVVVADRLDDQRKKYGARGQSDAHGAPLHLVTHAIGR